MGINRNCNLIIRNILCPHRSSSRRVRNASGLFDDIKLKLSACVVGDVEETKSAIRILLLMLLQLLLLCKDIKVKHLRNFNKKKVFLTESKERH